MTVVVGNGTPRRSFGIPRRSHVSDRARQRPPPRKVNAGSPPTFPLLSTRPRDAPHPEHAPHPLDRYSIEERRRRGRRGSTHSPLRRPAAGGARQSPGSARRHSHEHVVLRACTQAAPSPSATWRTRVHSPIDSDPPPLTIYTRGVAARARRVARRRARFGADFAAASRVSPSGPANPATDAATAASGTDSNRSSSLGDGRERERRRLARVRLGVFLLLAAVRVSASVVPAADGASRRLVVALAAEIRRLRHRDVR